MDDLEALAGGVEGGEGVALLAGDAGNLVAAEGGLAPGEDRAFPAGDVDDVAGGEFAGRLCHADGEEAAPLLAEHGHGAGVDEDGAGGTLKPGEPAFLRLHGQPVRDEKGPG